MARRDIRENLPRTPQTDINKFPEYNYQPYPRMMTKIQGDKKVPYLNNSGQPVVVNSLAEENAFKAEHGLNVPAEPVAKTVAINPVASLVAAAPIEAPREKRKYTKRLPANLTD